MKNALYPFLFIALIIFNSCNTSDKYRNYETTETFDCYEAETECLSLVKKNKDELKEILIREMERNPNDNEVTLQRTLDTFTGYQFASKFEKYQKILELNCPEESKRVNKQIALIIFGEIIEGS
jgi:hypothetical protein